MTETPTRKFDYRKWGIPIAVLCIIAVILISLFAIIPFGLGDSFVSYSFKIEYIPALNDHRAIEVMYLNGTPIKIAFIYFRVNVTNRYFMPVQVHHNGFDFVMLIYNSTVQSPTDVVANKPFLIWGQFYHYRIGSLSFSSRWIGGDPYEYYITHRNSSSTSTTISPGTHEHAIFCSPSVEPVWTGRDLEGNIIPPGIYYIYCIAYEKTLEPIHLNVTRTGDM